MGRWFFCFYILDSIFSSFLHHVMWIHIFTHRKCFILGIYLRTHNNAPQLYFSFPQPSRNSSFCIKWAQECIRCFMGSNFDFIGRMQSRSIHRVKLLRSLGSLRRENKGETSKDHEWVNDNHHHHTPQHILLRVLVAMK